MRVLSFGLLGLALAIAPCHSVIAQEWPNRPVTMVVPFPAGAAVDTLARAVAHALSEDFGKQFIVENRAGAGGNLGGTAVANSPSHWANCASIAFTVGFSCSKERSCPVRRRSAPAAATVCANGCSP